MQVKFLSVGLAILSVLAGIITARPTDADASVDVGANTEIEPSNPLYYDKYQMVCRDGSHLSMCVSYWGDWCQRLGYIPGGLAGIVCTYQQCTCVLKPHKRDLASDLQHEVDVDVAKQMDTLLTHHKHPAHLEEKRDTVTNVEEDTEVEDMGANLTTNDKEITSIEQNRVAVTYDNKYTDVKVQHAQVPMSSDDILQLHHDTWVDGSLKMVIPSHATMNDATHELICPSDSTDSQCQKLYSNMCAFGFVPKFAKAICDNEKCVCTPKSTLEDNENTGKPGKCAEYGLKAQIKKFFHLFYEFFIGIAGGHHGLQ